MGVFSKKTVNPTDPMLSQFAIDFANQEDMFIGDKIFPAVKVNYESGSYYIFDTFDRFTLPPTRRAIGVHTYRGDLSVTTSTYQTQEEAHEIPVDRRIQRTAESPLNPEKAATEVATSRILLRKEKQVLDAITDTTNNFSTNTAALAGNDRWDDANSDPVGKIDDIKETIRGNCGSLPNVGVINYATWLKLKEHPDIQARVKITNDTIVTMDLLARLFELDKLYVSMAKYNSAEEGQTVSLADAMGKSMFLGYVNPSPAINRPSVGYTIQKDGLGARKYFEDQTNSDVVRVSFNEVPKIVSEACGYVLTTVIS